MECKLVKELIVLINYWGLIVSILWYCYKCIKVIRKKEKTYFMLKTYERDIFEIDKGFMGSYMVVIQEVSKRNRSKVIKNGAETTCLITIKSDKTIIFRLTQLSGCQKERVEIGYDEDKLKIYYAPLPQDDVNEYRYYQVIFKEVC